VGSGFDDVVQVRATVVDENGIRVPRAAQELMFAVSGAGKIVAVDNGDLISHEPFQSMERKAFDGTAVAYVRASAKAGTLRVTASADGLKSGSVGIRANPR
jgi:beta-galactosidase